MQKKILKNSPGTELLPDQDKRLYEYWMEQGLNYIYCIRHFR